MAVVHGFDASYRVFSGALPRLDAPPKDEIWLVENVSLGGFRACLRHSPGDPLKLGTLLCLQPEGGDNWLLGVVRRFNRLSGERASLGIQLLSRQAQSVDLRPRRSGFAAAIGLPGIWLRDGSGSGLVRLLLPQGGFNLRESLEFTSAGQRHMLAPAELEESGSDYEIGRFHNPTAAA